MFAIAAAAVLAAAPLQPTAAKPIIPTGEELTKVIAARDAEFFELFFKGCDPPRLRTMLAPDVEFYHDKSGLLYHSADAMVADYAKNCAARLLPGAYHSRRELVLATLHVDPVPGFGAIEEATHYFYERKRGPDGVDGPESRVGYGRIAMVWMLSDDGWRLSRILSYAHRPAPVEARK